MAGRGQFPLPVKDLLFNFVLQLPRRLKALLSSREQVK
jgi:hypothetical protein